MITVCERYGTKKFRTKCEIWWDFKFNNTHAQSALTTNTFTGIFHSTLLIRHKIRRWWNESLVLFLCRRRRRRRRLPRRQLICCVLKVLSTEREFAGPSDRSIRQSEKKKERSLSGLFSQWIINIIHQWQREAVNSLWSTIQLLFFKFDNWFRWKPCDFRVSVNANEIAIVVI